jgi:hypothetical protein
MGIMTTNDIANFAYQIDKDNVHIMYSIKDVYGQTYVPGPNDEPVLELQGFSWSVPKSEIESMEDPTDYLKQAIVNANQ